MSVFASQNRTVDTNLKAVQQASMESLIQPQMQMCCTDPADPACNPNVSINEICYKDARNNYYSIETSSQICKGLVNNTCYSDARNNYYSIGSASTMCSGYINEVCFKDARNNYYSIESAAKLCK